MYDSAAALGYKPQDLARLERVVPGGLREPQDIGKVIDSFGYLGEWKEDYKIQSVRSALRSDRITCVDAAVLSYGLLEAVFPNVKRRILAIHRRDMHGEECGHAVTCYWRPDGKVGAFSKSSFDGFDHRPPVFEDEAAIALSFAQVYMKMKFVPLYYGVTTLEDAIGDLDWRLSPDHLNLLSERLKERYEYGFGLDG